MLGRRERLAELPSGWERFCREQARETVADFFEQARIYRSRDPTASRIPDARFASRFSAYVQDELALRGMGGEEHSTGITASRDRSATHANGLATAGPRHAYQYAQVEVAPHTPVGDTDSSKAKSWWNVFKKKWSNKASGRKNSATGGPASSSALVVLEGTVSLLDMKDPSQELAWQPCKLVLMYEQSNYQLKVFCPPKSPVPKMSLFCFLIEEVRSTSALELPDSDAAFVVKSPNHGEYVFDASSQEAKRKWITTIQVYSVRKTNGHVAMSNGHIAGASGSLLPAHYTGRFSPVHVDIASLKGSPSIPGRRTNGAAAVASDDGLHRVEGGEPASCDAAVFARPSPLHSPQRQRKVRSMFIDNHIVHPESHHVSPPPLPKRNTRPRSVSYSSNASPDHSEPSGGGVSHQTKLSQSCVDATEVPISPSVFHDVPTFGSLENCSASSSSSALHPVSLAAIQQRSKGASGSGRNGLPSPLLPPDSSQRFANGLDVPSRFRRKISAPVGPLHLAGESSRQVETDLEYQRDKYPSADGVNPTGLLGADLRLDTISGHNRSHSDGTGQTSGGNDSHSASGRGEIEIHPRRRFVTESESTDPRQDTPPTPYSPGSSSSDSEMGRTRMVATGNPIYVETTGEEGYNQPVTHTHHPYESWATNQQDVENLRGLSQYPWFHGMISRANASQLVLESGEEGTGQFLVRQSESREGDFVLTFNYHNRAKHLRMTIDSSACNIQHLWFDDVPSMLDYFKSNSIPLESFWLNDDVKLTTYIDQGASDAFRTTTVLNIDRLSRNPPRRAHSLHLSMANAVAGGVPASPTDSQSTMSQGSSSHSLPQSVRNLTGWRQVFRSQRASSAGNVGRVQRSHSANAGSILDARGRATPQTNSSENNYIYR